MTGAFPRETVQETQVENATLSVALDYDAVHDEYDGNIHDAITARLCANVALSHTWVQHIDGYDLDVATDGETAMVAVLSDFAATLWHGETSVLSGGDPVRGAERLLGRLPGVTVYAVEVRESYSVERYD